MSIYRGLAFVGLNVSLVGIYCWAQIGRLEPLKHEPERLVILPLLVITAVVSLFLYPLLLRLRPRLFRALTLYCGFVLISMLYGVHLWITFPDAGPWSLVLAVIGGHLYGWPPFLALLLVNLALGPWLFRDH